MAKRGVVLENNSSIFMTAFPVHDCGVLELIAADFGPKADYTLKVDANQLQNT